MTSAERLPDKIAQTIGESSERHLVAALWLLHRLVVLLVPRDPSKQSQCPEFDSMAQQRCATRDHTVGEQTNDLERIMRDYSTKRIEWMNLQCDWTASVDGQFKFRRKQFTGGGTSIVVAGTGQRETLVWIVCIGNANAHQRTASMG